MKGHQMVMKSGWLLFAAVLVGGCSSKDNPARQGKQPMRVPFVRVITVLPTRIEGSMETVGTVSSKRVAKILAPVDGAIEKLYVQENDAVRQNPILAVLSSTERMALLAETQARV